MGRCVPGLGEYGFESHGLEEQEPGNHGPAPQPNHLAERLNDPQILAQIQPFLDYPEGFCRALQVKTSRGLRWHQVQIQRIQTDTLGEPLLFVQEWDVSDRHHCEQLLWAQQAFFSNFAHHGSLASALNALLQQLETAQPGWRAAIFLKRSIDQLHCTAAPSLAIALRQALAQVPIAKQSLACGMAAHRQSPVIVRQLSQHPGWQAQAILAAQQDIQSAWSVPIFSSQQQLIGCISIYLKTMDQPYQADWQQLETTASLAAMAIEHYQSRLHLQESEMRFLRLFEEIPNIPVQGYDHQRRVIFWNRASEMLYGFTAAEAMGRRIEELIVPRPLRDDIVKSIDRWMAGGEPIPAQEVMLQNKQCQFVPVFSSHTLLHNRNGQPEMYCIDVDLSDRKRVEAELLYTASHDPLTGLYNRSQFAQELRRAIAFYQASQRLYTVLFVDLDRFKIINDSLGHLVGDQLLCQVAQRLSQLVNDTDVLARFGSDEFVILTWKTTPETLALVQRIIEAIAQPIELGSRHFTLRTSVGIAPGHGRYEWPEELLRDADLAVCSAKARGGGVFALFEPEMHPRALARLQLEQDLKQAIQQAELQLYYQPIVNLHSGQLEGFEALLRWHHRERGWVSPAEFVPIAEETGLIGPLSWWVFESACLTLGQWRDRFPQAAGLTVNVNLSAVHLREENIVSRMLQLLATHGLPGNRLKLEITESGVLEIDGTIATALEQLKAQRLSLCVDDFGTGQSSLSRLHHLPLDVLKIDRAFIMDLERDSKKQAIAQSIITLAHGLGATIVAEGIETEPQRRLLTQMGCESGQGYLFSRPVSAQEVERQLTAGGFRWTTALAGLGG